MSKKKFSIKTFIFDLFRIEKHPRRGLLPIEWAMLIYLGITLCMTLFGYTRISAADSMIRGRMNILVVLGALWTIYQLVPCRLTEMLRSLTQLALLGYWYPETYHLNGLFPNLDPYFAQFEQNLFGFQPALLFAKNLSNTVISEAMCLGYSFYFFFIVVVFIYYFNVRFHEFEKIVFVIGATFFAYYLIFDFLPVVGPMYYYKAVGIDNIVQGNFPVVGDYFLTHTDFLPTPGDTSGFFYNLVGELHTAGERPTAAFPSSHVGISTVCMMLVIRSRNRIFFWVSLPFYILLCLSTVYIMAHYAIDAIAGLISGVIFYYLFLLISNQFTTFSPLPKQRRR